MQAFVVIFIEKLVLKVPKVSGRMEKFYKTIVEATLKGNKCDFKDDRCPAVVAENRIKSEVCNSLRRSSVIHYSYVLKNLIQVFLLLGFISVNIWGIHDTWRQDGGKATNFASSCSLPLLQFPEVDLTEDGSAFFECAPKNPSFNLVLATVGVVLQFIVLICSTVSILWSRSFRSVTNLMKSIRKSAKIFERFESLFERFNGAQEGKDFLFLFDLLAHSIGL